MERIGDRLVLLRHLLAVLILPFTMTVLVPWRLRAGAPPEDVMYSGAGALIGAAVGFAVFVSGLLWFGWCVRLFARVGHGTLAPWDPTRVLVGVGPYRYVRNPMIAGVGLMLAGEAIYFGSARLTSWAIAFLIINHLYFVFVEEPALETRFGQSYREYKARVPRWLPRGWWGA